MSVLLFGVSHRSAPVSVLEQLSTDEAEQTKIIEQLLESSLVTEAMVLSTCNRVEVYAVVDAFHGGLSVIGSVLSERSGMSLQDLTKHAYVRYAEAAVEHLFSVASGLDSAVIGEAQVLGQDGRDRAHAAVSGLITGDDQFDTLDGAERAIPHHGEAAVAGGADQRFGGTVSVVVHEPDQIARLLAVLCPDEAVIAADQMPYAAFAQRGVRLDRGFD